ncbi:MAG: TatD family hydrolase [Gammaproteobacteria bacterium]|nr:TatD family hydrolase [Gammaproteobacteria bacterium]
MRMIDSHCHFDDVRFDHDRDAAYRRAIQAGVLAQVIPGVTAQDWPRIERICQRYRGLYPAYGVHPLFLHLHGEGDIQTLDAWLDKKQRVAVGECGLDFFVENPQRERQQWWFESQLALAQNHHLPVIIHARRAVEEVINTLRHFPTLHGVLHSYSGSEQQARRLMEMGFMMSFGGPVTYDRAQRLRKLVSQLPLDYIMLETDAPDQPDQHNRGGRNEPAMLGRVLDSISELRDEPADVIAEITTQNAFRLFGISA